MTASIVDGRVVTLAVLLLVAVVAAWVSARRARLAKARAAHPVSQPRIPEADRCMVSSPRCPEPWDHELNGWRLCTRHYQSARSDNVFDQEASS